MMNRLVIGLTEVKILGEKKILIPVESYMQINDNKQQFNFLKSLDIP